MRTLPFLLANQNTTHNTTTAISTPKVIPTGFSQGVSFKSFGPLDDKKGWSELLTIAVGLLVWHRSHQFVYLFIWKSVSHLFRDMRESLLIDVISGTEVWRSMTRTLWCHFSAHWPAVTQTVRNQQRWGSECASEHKTGEHRPRAPKILSHNRLPDIRSTLHWNFWLFIVY